MLIFLHNWSFVATKIFAQYDKHSKEREQKEEQANIVLLGKLSGGDPREERPEKRIAHLHDLSSNKEGKKMYNEESKSLSTYTSSAVETTSSAFGTSMEVGSSTGLYSNDSDW
uniref:Uncharacterized protein n=1 Tax=Proboscia inermis TaxID=420281 RepID=A0A7S0CBN4_9STRA|mmetsp:Transcript_39016/g.39460  ORF Transcript_39016/g.39460 Transcript_39016/m.39460 type:complete len:113 (+) Transcript_39016:1-339(+)